MALSRRSFLLGCAGLGAVATPLGWYSLKYEPGDLEITHRSVAIPGLSAHLDKLKVAQVSDLHLAGVAPVHLHMAEQLQSLQPDLIVVTGDLVDRVSAVGDVVELLGSVSPPLGVWAVAGNWDHTSEAMDQLARALKLAKVRFLVNQSAVLESNTWIVGVDDPASSNDDLEASLQGVPAGARRILLAHSPHIARELKSTQMDLVLCGHTHGGQINLPLVNGTWLKDASTRHYIQGLYDVHGSPMYVNRGIGMTSLPVRIACRPELTMFTLHAA